MLQILGLQKLTLLDYPGNMACTVFLGGCNFRCPFCHNRALVVNPDFESALPQEELFSFLEKRRGILDGVCITGGEPLLSDDVLALAHAIKQMGYLVKLDTNGTFPERLERIIASGDIDYVAMDVKSSPANYKRAVGVESFRLEPVQKSISLLLSDVIPYEFRTTLVRELHTEQDIAEIGAWISGAKQYFLQAFVDSGELIQDGLHGFTREETEHFLEILRPNIPQAAIRGME